MALSATCGYQKTQQQKGLLPAKFHSRTGQEALCLELLMCPSESLPVSRGHGSLAKVLAAAPFWLLPRPAPCGCRGGQGGQGHGRDVVLKRIHAGVIGPAPATRAPGSEPEEAEQHPRSAAQDHQDDNQRRRADHDELAAPEQRPAIARVLLPGMVDPQAGELLQGPAAGQHRDNGRPERRESGEGGKQRVHHGLLRGPVAEILGRHVPGAHRRSPIRPARPDVMRAIPDLADPPARNSASSSKASVLVMICPSAYVMSEPATVSAARSVPRSCPAWRRHPPPAVMTSGGHRLNYGGVATAGSQMHQMTHLRRLRVVVMLLLTPLVAARQTRAPHASSAAARPDYPGPSSGTSTAPACIAEVIGWPVRSRPADAVRV